jgi:hypothetical protein
LAGEHAPDHQADAAAPLGIDVDAHPGDRTLGEGTGRADVHARRRFHPLWAFVDHRHEGTGQLRITDFDGHRSRTRPAAHNTTTTKDRG